jgi:hypothetical protein
MKEAKFVPATFIYVQGLSLANLIYLVFLSLFVKKFWAPMFRPSQLLILMALLICQFLAILAAPHELPMSMIATLFGLIAFTVRPDLLFSWDGSNDMRKSYRRIFVWVIVVYLIDSLLRIQYLKYNWVGWSDYELKTWIKTSSWLVDDTNTLGIRVIFLYFIARSINFLKSRPWMLRGLFLYLALSSYSRAAIGVLLLVFVFDTRMASKLFKMKFVIPSLVLGILIAIKINLLTIVNMSLDSSEISKLELVTGSFNHWVAADWWERLFGLGYYSNINVGILNWASGHSIFYYALVDFGVLGTLLLGALIFRCATTEKARLLLVIYLILGVSVFRFDFLFLYVTVFFVEYVQIGRKNSNPTQVKRVL